MRKGASAGAGLLLAFGTALAACGGAQETPAPDPASADESRALAEAAEMLDAREPPPPAPAQGDGNE